MNYSLVPTHIEYVKTGDTVMHNGHLLTVCRSDIRTAHGETTLFGDSYRLGTLPVMVAAIERALPVKEVA